MPQQNIDERYKEVRSGVWEQLKNQVHESHMRFREYLYDVRRARKGRPEPREDGTKLTLPSNTE